MNAAAYRSEIARTVRRAGKGTLQPEDVEDLVQETLLALWKRQPICPPEAAAAYARRTAYWVTIDEIRRRLAKKRGHGRQVTLELVQPVAAGVSPEEALLAEESLIQLLVSWVPQLPRNGLIIIMLKYLLGYSSHEIGAFLGRTSSGINSTLTRVRQRLGQTAVEESRSALIAEAQTASRNECECGTAVRPGRDS